MSCRIYDMRELVDGIQRPYAPMLPDWDEHAQREPRWSMDVAYQMLTDPPSREWQSCVLNRLKRIDYLIPDYVDHDLTKYLRIVGVIGVFQA